MKRLICCWIFAFATGAAVAQARPDANTAKIFKGYSLTELTASGLLYNPQAKATYYKALGPLVKESWLAKLDGPSNEFRPVKVAGADYMLGGTCKNHDCYDNTVVLLWSGVQDVVYGPEPGSQLAVPLACAGQFLGVLFVESPHDMRFSWDDEDALAALAAQAAALARGFQACAEAPDDEAATAEALLPAAQLAPLRVRHYEADGSVFLGDDYVIKGVAGAVLWKLLRDHASEGRTDFSNRELRLSPEIGLPEVCDNLEGRLVLLTRRLVDRQASVQLLRTGRGRFRLHVARPLQLANVPR